MIELLETRRVLSGQTITVDVLSDTTTAGHTTLRDAIAIANADGGDTIQFASGLNGTITLTQGVLSVTNAMIITGPGANLLTISGNNSSQIFDIGSSTSTQFAVTISGLTLSSGYTSNNAGGAIYNAKNLTLTDNFFTGNQAISGGAVANVQNATLISSHNTYSGNATVISGQGGGITSIGSLTSSYDTFLNNTVISNGSGFGGFGGGISASGQVSVTNDTFTGNTAVSGGGLAINSGGSVTISGNLVSYNTAYVGGGLYVWGSNLLTSMNDQFIGNTASAAPSDGGGGGISSAGNLVMINDVVSGNQAPRGGGIYNGGLYYSGTLSINNSTISNNTAVAGGGLYHASGYQMNIYGTTFVGNSASQSGGAILSTQQLLSTNDTYVNNTAGGGGGAIRAGGYTMLVHDTVTGNQASLGSGIYGGWGAITSIVAGNVGSDFDTLPAGINTNNLLGVPAGKTLSDILQTVPNSNPLQPLLANNGGPTQTVALTAGGPAVGTGGSLFTLTQAVSSQSNLLYFNYYHNAIYVGELLRIDNEVVRVTALLGQGVSVARGQSGTTAAAHSVNAALNLAFDATGAPRINNDLGAVAVINHAPLGKSATLTWGIGQAYTLKISDFGMTDPNDTPPNSLLAVKFNLLSSAGTLTDFGQVVTAGQSVSASDISAGGLVFTPSFSQTGTYFLAKFQVQDNGGTANGGVDLDPNSRLLYLNYVVPNHAPVGTTSTVTSSLGTPYPLKPSDFGFTDPNDTVPNSFLAVQITLLPGLGTLTLDGAAVAVNQFISVSDIAAGKLVFTPTVTQPGTFFLCKFRVQDNGGTANGGADLDQVARVLYINLVTLNHAPVGTTNTIPVAVGGPYTVKAADFGFTDPNDTPPNSLLAAKITLLPSLGTLTLSGVPVTAGQFVSAADIHAGRLIFTPFVSQSGTYFLCKFQVQDNGNTTYGSTNLDPTAKVLYFQPFVPNHSPVGTTNTVTTSVNSPYVLKTSDFGFTDPNDTPPNSLFAVQFTLLPTLGVVTLDGTPVTANQFISAADISAGKLVLTPTVSQPGTYFLCKFRVQDNGGTANGGLDTDQVARVLYFNLTAAIEGSVS